MSTYYEWADANGKNMDFRDGPDTISYIQSDTGYPAVPATELDISPDIRYSTVYRKAGHVYDRIQVFQSVIGRISDT